MDSKVVKNSMATSHKANAEKLEGAENVMP